MNEKIKITPEMVEFHFFKNGEYKAPITFFSFLQDENENKKEIEDKKLHHINAQEKINTLQVPNGWILYDNWKNNPYYTAFYNDPCEGKKTKKKPDMDPQNLGTLFLVLKSRQSQSTEPIAQPSKKRKMTRVPVFPITLGTSCIGSL